MMLRRNDRNLENIPVGALGLIALDGCTEMGAKVNDYLVKWRKEDGHIHKNDVASVTERCFPPVHPMPITSCVFPSCT